MMTELGNKVTAVHLKRAAYLYVRQSTLRQVVEHTESTKRQYALKQRAVQLGWRPEQVTVIDSDLGESGASTVDRDGFQKLVAEVSMGRAGIVLGLEVSRLARNSADWHRLLEICPFNDTLILDEDGIYNPGAFNDRLLLGLKGTMSEAELHVMRMRMIGGVLTKARRGEANQEAPQGGTGPNTIAMLVAHYRLKELATDRNGRKAFSTRSAYECNLENWILPRWGDHTLDQVKSVAVEEWLDGIKRAKGTRAKIRNLMSALFTHAMRYEWADRNPIKLVRQSAKRERHS
jgi:DNA invertase Pin-like site-specific DNA recombinase